MKTILYITPQLRRGGGEKQLLLLLKHLDRSRFSPVIACLEDHSEYTQDLSELNIPVYHFSGGKIHQISMLIRLMRDKKASIIHTWLNNEWGRIAAILYQAIFFTSLIVISSERDEMQFSSRRFRSFFIYLGRILSFFTTKVTFNSPKALTYWEKGVFKSGTGVFIGNGIEESEINDQFHAQTHPPLKIVVVARLVVQKNMPFMLRALASYPRRDMIRISLIGDGPLRGELETLVTRLDVSNQVVFLGKRSDVPTILRQQDIGMLCSHSEGFSNAILEYIANGLAVIATDAGANAICINQNGFIVAHENDIHNAWDAYLDTPILLATHQRKSIELSKNFTISQIADQYQALYDGGDRVLQST